MLTMSIRWRLTFWYAAALTTILVVFCGLLVPVSYHQHLARLDDELREELHELSLEVHIAKTPQELDTSLHTRFETHEMFNFFVNEEQGGVLFASSDVTPEMASQLSQAAVGRGTEALATELLAADQYYRIASVLVEGPHGKLVVRVLTPLAPVIADTKTLMIVMALLLPPSLLLALLGGYFLAARVLAPVEHIVGVANSISIAQLDRRIEVANPHDELGHLASTINRLIARLEHAVEEIRRFTADASHELRTPLAILRSEAESALRKSRTEQEYQATLRVVVEEATRLGTLADQLLILSRQDAGLDTLRLEPVEIDPVLLDTIESLSPLAQSHRVQLHADCDSGAVISGNDIRLSQVFFNIIENAIKYSPEDTVVEVASKIVGDQCQIVIRDHGIGIPPEHLPRVFERFYRVDSSRNRAIGGSGLGLAIARSIVTAHGGTIEIQSEANSGTEVTLGFPKLESSARKSTSNQYSSSAHRSGTLHPQVPVNGSIGN